MAEVKYTVIDQELTSIPEVELYSGEDIDLIENFIINKSFNYDTNYIESHFYAMNQIRLLSLYDYELPNKDILAKNVTTFDEDGDEDSRNELISQVTVDPSTLADQYGYGTTEVRILFHFLNDSFTFDNTKHKFFVKSISKDRTEVALYSNTISFSRLRSSVNKLKDKLINESYFDELYLNFGNNDLFIVTNIDTFKVDNQNVVTVKLYEPLPNTYNTKSTLQVVEKVSDSIAVKVTPEIIEEPPAIPKIKGPNFGIETSEIESDPTEFLSYNELFSFANNNTNRELFSFVQEKSIDLAIDYSNYDNFINFSSAAERLKNFKYKFELIQTYQSDLDTENALGNTSTSAVSGSIAANESLIKNIIDNFDHYDRFLYYESGSNSWPKSNSEKPFINYHSTSSEATTWYANQLISASNYDTQNYDVLTNFLPDYISEDSRNLPAVVFTQMIGQHYDNLWIYSKSISKKYDTDHRIDKGLPQDVIKDAIRSMGVKVYNSVEGSNDLFKYLINDSYDSGSAVEIINNFVSAESNGGGNTNQPISRKKYEAELYKRIYHNIPFLLKNKGTNRGVRALINCFGIPATYLRIKTHNPNNAFLGNDASAVNEGDVTVNTGGTGSLAGAFVFTGSLEPATGSITLSQHTSINYESGSYLTKPKESFIEIGFSPVYKLDSEIEDLDPDLQQYFGDPTNLNKDKYELFGTPNTNEGSEKQTLLKTAEQLIMGSLSTNTPINLKDFTRIFKFYDNVLFKMLKDFLPARAQLTAGIIIKSHIAERNKIKSPSLTGSRPEHSASIDTAFISGSSPGVYNVKDNSKFIDTSHSELPAPWHGQIGGAFDGVFLYNSQIGVADNRSEDGEIGVTAGNFYHPDGTLYPSLSYNASNTGYEDQSSILTPFEKVPAGNAHNDFFIMFTSESAQSRFPSLNQISTTYVHKHFVPVSWNTSTNYYEVRSNKIGDRIPLTGSITRSNDAIISAVNQDGLDLGLPVHEFYTSLIGNNVYMTGSFEAANHGLVDQITIIAAGSGGVTGSSGVTNIASSGSSPLNLTGAGSGLRVNVDAVNGSGGLVQASIIPGNEGSGYQSGKVTAVSVQQGGSGYSVVAGVSPTSGNATTTGVGLVLNYTVNSGAVNAVTSITDRGQGYKVGDIVVIPGGNGGALIQIDGVQNDELSVDTVPNSKIRVDQIKGIPGPLPASKQGHLNATTWYDDQYKSLSGSVSKLVNDESPRITGELSGSELVVVDGELNDDNLFKKAKTDPVNYDIVPIAQGAADTLKNFSIFNNAVGTAGTAQAACQLSSNNPVTKYHTGDNDSAVVNDFVHNLIDGTDAFNGQTKRFKVLFDDNQNDTFHSARIATNGEITELINCDTFDSTPPNAFSYGFTVANINPQNFTNVGFEVHGIAETVTLQYTASTSGDSAGPIQTTQTLTAAATHSINFDSTALGDGTITLHVSASDAAGNTTNGTVVNDTVSTFGKTVVKNLALPPTPTVKFVHVNDIGNATQSNCTVVPATITGSGTQGDPVYSVIVGNLNNFTGSITVTLSGNSDTISRTVSHPDSSQFSNWGASEHLVEFNGQSHLTGKVSKRTTPYNNTVFATAFLTANNNNGATSNSDSVTFKDYTVTFDGSYETGEGFPIFNTSPFAASGQTKQIDIRVPFVNTPYTMSRGGNDVCEFGNSSTSFASSFQGTGDDTTFQIRMPSHTSTNSRTNTVFPSVQVDGKNFYGNQLTVVQAASGSSCVDGETKILTPDNFILAKEIKTGDIVRTKGEYDQKWYQDIVTGVRKATEEPRTKLTFEDGEIFIASDSHRVYYEGQYVPMHELIEGDKISNKIIEKIEKLELGDVYQITTEKTHTYISNGILSHNAKNAPGGNGNGVQ